MVTFHLLGGQDLIASDGHRASAEVQPKQLALLAYLLLCDHARLVNRERLLAMFWPELDEEHGRNVLNQHVHRLRTALGADAVLSNAGCLGVRREIIDCDALAFEEALKSGELECALDVYSGDLLPGFHLTGTPEFEHWLDEERADLRRRAHGTALELAHDAEAEGEAEESVRWLRRAHQLCPEKEDTVRRLVEALATVGDVAGAVDVYRDFETYLAEEYDLEPSAEFRDQLLSTVEHHYGVVDHSIETPHPARPLDLPRLPIPGGLQSVLRRRGVIASTAFTLVALGAVLWAGRQEPGPEPLLFENAVMVRPIDNLTGDANLGHWGRFATDQITNGLARIDDVRLVASRAEKEVRQVAQASGLDGLELTRATAVELLAGLIIEGWYRLYEDTIVFTTRLMDTNQVEVFETVEARGRVNDAHEVIGVLTERTTVAVATRLHLGDQYVGSYGKGDSYQAWEAVDRARSIRDAEQGFRAALPHLYRALEYDSTYEPAIGLAMIWHQNLGEWDRADSLSRILVDRVEELAPRQRWQFDVFTANLRHDRVSMVRAFRDWKDRLPNASRLLHLASGAAVAGRPRECLEAVAETDLRGTRFARDSWMSILESRCHHDVGDYEASLASAREGLNQSPEDLELHLLAAAAEAALGRVGDASQTTDRAVTLTDEPQSRYRLLADLGLELLAHGHREAGSAALARAADWFLLGTGSDTASIDYRWNMAWTLYDVRRDAEALAILDGLDPVKFAQLYEREGIGFFAPTEHNLDLILIGARGALAARLGDTTLALDVDRELAGMDRSWLWGENTYWRAIIAAQLGERDRAVDLLSDAISEGLYWYPWGSNSPKWEFHVDPDFSSLRGYEPFETLIAPRD